ncbi:unnamed protein product [Phaeothamnion confervicola]
MSEVAIPLTGSDSPVPKLIVFDLDNTIWTPELYEMYGAPFRRKGGALLDRSGMPLQLFRDIPEILKEAATYPRFAESRLAVASRTEHDDWAAEAMRLLHAFDDVPMNRIFDAELTEVYPSTKTRHFRRLRENSGVDYHDMLFFDDWSLNTREVGALGVTSIVCPSGMTRAIWDRGLALFAARRLAAAGESGGGGGGSGGSGSASGR